MQIDAAADAATWLRQSLDVKLGGRKRTFSNSEAES
jgi:hypothetical protein